MTIEDEIFVLIDTLISTKDERQYQAIVDRIDTFGPYNVLKFLSIMDRHCFEDYPENLSISAKTFSKLLFFEGFALQRCKLSLLLLNKISDQRNIEIWNALRASNKFSYFINSPLYTSIISCALEKYEQIVIEELKEFIATIPTEEEILQECQDEEKSLLLGNSTSVVGIPDSST